MQLHVQSIITSRVARVEYGRIPEPSPTFQGLPADHWNSSGRRFPRRRHPTCREPTLWMESPRVALQGLGVPAGDTAGHGGLVTYGGHGATFLSKRPGRPCLRPVPPRCRSHQRDRRGGRRSNPPHRTQRTLSVPPQAPDTIHAIQDHAAVVLALVGDRRRLN